MANTSSAQKAIRVSGRNAVINVRRKRAFKDARGNVVKAVVAGDKKAAVAAMPKAYKEIDKAAKNNIIHKKTASRYKSNLASQVKSLK